jgi:hypothetical protein
MMRFAYRFLAICYLTIFFGCSFNFELTSQKTALENQVMGSYKELDDEVLMMASVRAVDSSGNLKKKKVQSDDAAKAIEAKQNQEFNRDDIDELKEKQILGEAKDGSIVVLPKDVGLAAQTGKKILNFAGFLVAEENRDRKIVVDRIVKSHQDLTKDNFEEARKIYRSNIINNSPVGTWIENPNGIWGQKIAGEVKLGVTP